MVFGITETWYDENTSEEELVYLGCTTLRSDRCDVRVGGGVALILRSDMNNELQEVAVPHPTDVLDVLVHLLKSKLRVLMVNRPPASSPEADRGLLEFVTRVSNGCHRFLIMDDFDLPTIDRNTLCVAVGSSNRK